MNTRILNRDFQHPSDGWYMIEPKGEHPNHAAGVVQVIDEEAINTIVNRFNADAESGKLSHGQEMLIDHEHFKHDDDQETRAYGWLTRLQNRADGIYGQVRWTSTGKTAVDGGDYRFFSSEYDREDLKTLNDSKPRRVRPLRLDGLTLTNQPNNRGAKPITNRSDLPAAPDDGQCPDCCEELEAADDGDDMVCPDCGRHFCKPADELTSLLTNKKHSRYQNSDGSFKEMHLKSGDKASAFNGCVLHMMNHEGHSEDSAKAICGKIAQQVANRFPNFADASGRNPSATPAANQQPQQKAKMKNIAQKLGLAAEASEDSILAEVTKLQNRVRDLEPLGTENSTLKNRIAQFDSEQADGLLAERKITDTKVINRLKPVLIGLKDRADRIAFLDECGFKAPETKTATGQTKLFNRDTKPPTGEKTGNTETNAAEEQAKATKVMNRANELMKQTKNLSLPTAVRMAQREQEAA